MRRAVLAAAFLAALAGAAVAADSRVTAARRTLAEINAEEALLAAKIGANRTDLARLLGALQRFGKDRPPALLVSPGDAKDAVRAAILIRAITPELEIRAKALQAQAAALTEVRRRAAAASGDLFAAESALSDRRSRLEGVMRDANDLRPPSARSFSNALARQPAPTSLLSPTPVGASTRYGGRLADGTRAKGVAFRPAAGSQVISPASGVVDYVGTLNGWGQVLILRAGGGSHMVLSGLGIVSVATGQSVAAGQVVGAMPAEGKSPELYFEVRMRGAPVDPAQLISGPPRETVAGLRR
jgi:septal ring factor EnvC (AmiA/AmiB activator)